ncbi:MAG: hypothetical protein ACE5KW_03415, partial [Dehalococcoidia bacterium]
MRILARLRSHRLHDEALLLERPAFYALALGRWRDYVTLLHPPYTIWHLSYVVLGAALAPTVRYERLGATLLAFFLAMGIAAHALDEANGRPLRTRIPDRVLYSLTALGLAGAVALGILGAVLASPWLIVFILFGAFIVPAYNLELFGGRFHSDFWFALSWGTFPLLTAYWASAEALAPSAAAGAAAAFLLSLAQRALSARVRTVRRRVRDVEGTMTYTDGRRVGLDKRQLVAADERALLLLSVAVATASL